MNKKRQHKTDDEMEPFSKQLDTWLVSPGHNTVHSLSEVFGEKTFAITFLLLMAIPALPIPTGGVTHVFEVIVMLLSLQLIIAKKELWLPEKWRNKKLGSSMEEKAIPKLIKIITKLEKISKPRMSKLLTSKIGTSVYGTLVLAFTLTAFFAPPFSGLDTLPSIGVLLLSLGIILEDILFIIFGSLIGVTGMATTFFLGELVVDFVKGLF